MSVELEELKDIIKEDAFALNHKGDECDGFVTVERKTGSNLRWHQPVALVTRGPSGQHYRWHYRHALTEYQEHEFPTTDPILVEPVERTVTYTEYVRS